MFQFVLSHTCSWTHKSTIANRIKSSIAVRSPLSSKSHEKAHTAGLAAATARWLASSPALKWVFYAVTFNLLANLLAMTSPQVVPSVPKRVI